MIDLNGVTFSEYQTACQDTAIYPEKFNLVYGLTGLIGELGEMYGRISKVMRDKNGVFDADDYDYLVKEFGDCEWFMSDIATNLGIDRGEAAKANLAKLKSRKERGTLRGSGDNR